VARLARDRGGGSAVVGLGGGVGPALEEERRELGIAVGSAPASRSRRATSVWSAAAALCSGSTFMSFRARARASAPRSSRSRAASGWAKKAVK
jgi:hypothetical protein